MNLRLFPILAVTVGTLNVQTAADRPIFKLSNGTDDVSITLNVSPTAFKACSAGEDQNDPGGNSLSADQTCHVWFEYGKGTGANAVIRLYFATTATKPGTDQPAAPMATHRLRVARTEDYRP
jgi:hypothetical protein